MNIETATVGDIDQIEKIYADARAYMRENGNLEQWQGGYPSREIIENDINENRLYLVKEKDEILGVFCFFLGNDPTYDKIYGGEWLNDKPYGVIHRIAVSAHRKGVASFCFEHCFNICKNLKIDTHRDNAPMRKSLIKNGFTECGIIYLLSGDERIAFQRV